MTASRSACYAAKCRPFSSEQTDAPDDNFFAAGRTPAVADPTFVSLLRKEVLSDSDAIPPVPTTTEAVYAVHARRSFSILTACSTAQSVPSCPFAASPTMFRFMLLTVYSTIRHCSSLFLPISRLIFPYGHFLAFCRLSIPRFGFIAFSMRFSLLSFIPRPL